MRYLGRIAKISKDDRCRNENIKANLKPELVLKKNENK